MSRYGTQCKPGAGFLPLSHAALARTHTRCSQSIASFAETSSQLEVDVCVTTRGCDFKGEVLGQLHGLEPRLQQLIRLVRPKRWGACALSA